MSTSPKPFSPACERNREPIFDVLARWLPGRQDLLEIGSGTGQHAVYFASRFPALRWQCTERAPALAGIRAWLDEAALPNTPPPLPLDVMDDEQWPVRRYDAVFTANTLHYMSWQSVQRFFERLPRVLGPAACLIAYGPFNRDGRYTSDSNEKFDAWLKTIDPTYAIRDLGDIDTLAARAGLTMVEDNAMPANNRCVVWQAGPG